MIIENIDFTNIVILLVCVIISLWVTYYIIKIAVRDGVIAASMRTSILNHVPNTRIKNIEPTEDQNKLQKQYELGEITFEDYENKWNELYK